MNNCGWICPKCYAVYAPWVQSCLICLNNKIPAEIPNSRPDNIDLLFNEINSLNLLIRTINCLKYEKFFYIGDIVCNTRFMKNFNLLLKIPNFGKRSLNDLMQELTNLKLNKFIDYPDYQEERLKKFGSKYINKFYGF